MRKQTEPIPFDVDALNDAFDRIEPDRRDLDAVTREFGGFIVPAGRSSAESELHYRRAQAIKMLRLLRWRNDDAQG